MVIHMYMREALKIFNGRPGVIKALEGARHRSAVYQWDEDRLVPLGAALILARKAGKELNMDHYERQERKRLRQLERARAIRHGKH
jgi:hypothetical protein